MLRSNWVKLAAIGGIIFLSSLTLIAWGLAETSKYQRQADYRANDYAEYSREKVGKSCVGPLTVNQADCVEQARKEARENQRDEQDLVAQRQSALWAYVMAVAAVIGMALSAVGVFLVYTTFDATRKANEIAKKNVRPWVVVERFEIKRLRFENVEWRQGIFAIVEVEIQIKNIGQTPAYAFLTSGETMQDIKEQIAKIYPVTFEGDCLAPNQKRNINIFRRAELEKWADNPNDDVDFFNQFFFMVSLRYASQREAEPHETRQFWKIGSRVEEYLQFWSASDAANGNLSADLIHTSHMT